MASGIRRKISPLGIDQFDLGSLPPDLPVVRMIEPGISAAMAEYVTLTVLDLQIQSLREAGEGRLDHTQLGTKRRY
ncbi:hypothetical protein [Mesorhizobium sp.]|uniref:hypothetical protein n=1 Tax=Mesorhizobium sp. TaxID=1871066 RepID=UPI002579D14A|nr:hypothetical protein [Mesorhizobium sp.]